MIGRAVVVPNPPLLVPELVTGAAAETESLRRACVAAATALAQVAGEWIAIAADPAGPARIGPGARGTFRGFGVDVPVSLSADHVAPPVPQPDVTMPLPALVAGWLRDRAGAERVHVELVPPDLPPAECVRLGEKIAGEATGGAPVGLLVLGEGSNRHGDRAPARPDDRAGAFDQQARTAFARADPHRLLGLDASLAAELGAVGRAAWQVLAGVVLADGRPWRADQGELLVPYGVAYHVAMWDPA